MKSHSQILESILAIEVGAARIEGAFLADPELGLIWRAQAALTEACRSVSLEDINIREGDVATRPLREAADDFETSRGAWFVGELLRVMLSPGDILRDPERSVRRAMRAGLRPEGTEPGIGEGDAEIYTAVARSLEEAPGPLLGALRASLTLRHRTMSASPSAERLLFMSADHAFRNGRAGRELSDALPEGLGLTASEGAPQWILLPATSLTTGGFRIWSPGSSSGLVTLLDALRLETGRGLGALPVLRRWRASAQRLAAGKRGGSRMRDLAHLVAQRPILTGQIVSDRLSITGRAALNLLNEATQEGVLREITRRRSYRAWASAPMAERLEGRTSRPKASFHRNLDDRPDPPDWEAPTLRDRSSEERALEELDAALGAADEILRKYQGRDHARKSGAPSSLFDIEEDDQI